MSEKILQQILEQMTALQGEIKEVKKTMATKEDVKAVNEKLDSFSNKLDKQHLQNIHSDESLLGEVRSIKEGVVFVNRKVADAGLELNLLKQGNKQ